MGKARAILKRRKAVENIRKITRTMQLIATARFQNAFKRATGAKPYTAGIMQLAGQLAGGWLFPPRDRDKDRTKP